MQRFHTQLLALLTALTLVVGASLIASPTSEAKRATASKGKKASKEKHKRTPKLTARRGRGTAHVPRALLGERWAKIGSAPSSGGGPPPVNTTKPSGTTTTPTPTTSRPGEPQAALALGVALYDGAQPWSIRPSKNNVPKGTYTVQMQNMGEDPHDLIVYRISDSTTVAAFDTLQPSGQQHVASVATKQVNLGSPGQYRLFCSIDNHASLGMDAMLTVTN